MISGITGLGSGFDYMVMESDYRTEKVIKAFEEYIRQGVDPTIIEQAVYEQTGTNPADLTFYDRNKIQRRVEAAVATRRN